MSFPKIIIIGAVVTFGSIASMAVYKKKSEANKDNSVCTIKPNQVQEILVTEDNPVEKVVPKVADIEEVTVQESKSEGQGVVYPEADNIDFLFTTDAAKSPLVETVTYTSRVPWLSGRPAWIADYASHYETTRHFIARSLNKKIDYFTQKVAAGDRFNVLKKDVSFHILIDLSASKMWLYGIDGKENKRYLLKNYQVGVGRKDSKKASGYLTPLGKYLLGSRVAIYKPKTMGYFQDRQIEMIKVFGTRWMPFDKEVEGCTESAKGFGIHGCPWFNDKTTGDLLEDREKIGRYESDGCVRLFSEDIEEIFAIVISKPTVIEIVSDFREANLPGEE